MPLYTFLHKLLNVLVQIANKMGLQKKRFYGRRNVFIEPFPSNGKGMRL
jgi:hypothetical protein